MTFSSSDFALVPGVSFTPDGTRFVVYSQHASAVDLCLYHADEPGTEIARVRMQRTDDHLWHATVRAAGPGTLYGYRAHGSWHPERGQRFNPHKLLLDPYARAIVGKPDAADHMLGTNGPDHLPGSLDNGSEALKSVVIDESFDWQDDKQPRIPWRDTVIYECHVKGLTRTHPDIPAELRGTYAGLAHPAATAYLRDLGVTAVQLLPVHAHLDDSFLLDRGLTNYWGYNTLGFFAPHGEYASTRDPHGQLREFKGMVKALHRAGIEVILDVVYNHTAEGDPRGPTLMFRGLDDSTYYRQDADHNYLNVTGCGNSMQSAWAPGLRLILDSLRYWVTEMHVDGFRFDLAVTVARDELDHYNLHTPFLAAIAQDPVLSRVKLIAEPWDIGRMDSYQVGGFPIPWRELNGKFRDTVRQFWRGDPNSTAEFAKRFCGSQDIYGGAQRPPLASVNFITSHDGFTLSDLVSYSHKHNLANGEENRDGDDSNHSTNCGVEGVTDDRIVLAKRARLKRGLLASLLLSTGVPFLQAGDERGRTQRGNNNAYCQDNEISWIDWSSCDQELLTFTQQLLHLRRTRQTFRRVGFYTGQRDPISGLRDVTWLEGDNSLLGHDQWHARTRRHFGALLDGVAGEPPLLLLFNRAGKRCLFSLPGTDESRWSILFDTARMQVATHPGASTISVGATAFMCLELTAGPALAPGFDID